MLNELVVELNTRGANFVKVVDITMLSAKESRGYNVAILIGKVLSPDYIFSLSKANILDKSKFSETERKADKLAEWTANFINAKGYKAFAQSEENLLLHGFYDEMSKATPLPHKSIAIMAGLGWMGKNNLLVTQEYGSAFCMCTVLTNAPFPTENKSAVLTNCGKCFVCKDVCQEEAIYGSTWKYGMDRDLIVNVYNCNSCLKCLTYCPWTQKYMKENTIM